MSLTRRNFLEGAALSALAAQAVATAQDPKTGMPMQIGRASCRERV